MTDPIAGERVPAYLRPTCERDDSGLLMSYRWSPRIRRLWMNYIEMGLRPMTSYSTYGTGRIRIVDGDLSTDDEQRDEDFELVVSCLAAGAARALLDTTHDVTDPPGGEETEVYAEQWHSAEEGWELEAIADDDREKLLAIVREFASDHLTRIIWLANRIAWDPRYAAQTWSRDFGMALYRVGQLLGYEGAGTGIGFTDYSLPSDYDTRVMSEWVTVQGSRLYGWEQSWIDGTEEPCLLHLSA